MLLFSTARLQAPLFKLRSASMINKTLAEIAERSVFPPLLTLPAAAHLFLHSFSLFSLSVFNALSPLLS